MTLKQLVEQQLDVNALMAEIGNLDKTSKATDNIAQGLQKSPDLQKALTPFQQMVKQQLAAKKQQAMQAQQMQKQQQQAQQQAAQAAKAAAPAANAPAAQAGTAATPTPQVGVANMQ